MRSQKSREGYLLIDNRACGVPAGNPALQEFATRRCSHCHRIVILNPERKRERTFCTSCNSYLCDNCGVTYGVTRECKPLDQIIDEAQEAAALAEQAADRGGQIIIPS